MARIVTVYNNRRFQLVDMSYIRWFKISEALARRGHQVDIAMGRFSRWWWKAPKPPRMSNLRRVPLDKIRWHDYDVVKTLFQEGFDLLSQRGGADHPFIISKLGSVVGPQDMPGIYFYGRMREKLYETQQRIHQASKYIALLSQPARELWIECLGPRDNILLVPGAADREVSAPRRDPYPERGRPRCIFAGNVYGPDSQPEANRVLIDKLNRLGKLLSNRGIRLYMLGPGDVQQLDRRYVTYLGVVPYEQAWSYFHHADVGIVVAAGEFMHNNESTKTYHYLRVGLPVVSEAGFPNDNVVTESKLGFVVENGNMERMAMRIEEAARANWDRDYGINYILRHHTWDKRVEVYDKIIKDRFA